MAGYGYAGDVNNSISAASAYPGGRTFGMVPPAANRYRFRTNTAGELGAVNQGDITMATSNVAAAAGPDADNSPMSRPLQWWLVLAVIFVVIVWLMKRFAPSEQKEFGNINPGLYNGVFLTLYIVLILNVLKVLAVKMKGIPGLNALADLILAA
jgi:hypothetical protein